MRPLTITLKRPTPRKSLGFLRGTVLDGARADGWEAQPGAVVHVLFAGIPLDPWKTVASSDRIEALDAKLLRPSGAAYKVTDWHTGGVRPSPTGRDLHFVYATLLCLDS